VLPAASVPVKEAGMAWRSAVRIELDEAERCELEARTRRRKISRADAMRAEIVLLAADGTTNLAIAEQLGVTRVTVATWRKRFAAKRLDGLADEPRPGAPRKIGDEKIAEVVTTTLETMPAAATHWSTRSMAKASGLSISTVHRIWRAFSLQPHRSETFKLSADPLFVDKVRDIVGLYLNPPDHALVLCVDEKSQIQALDRTQPLLPMRPGQAERRTHDYKRHGTTSLFAALDVKAGTIIGKCMPRHRAQEFRRFLDTVEQHVPADLDIHIVMDNASSHKTNDPRLVRQTAPLAYALHADILVMDKPGRALLRIAHRPADQARRPPLYCRVGGRYCRLHRRPQCRPQALSLDQNR
jgi:transposase